MTRKIEVVFEDNVLKPLAPIEGLKEHQQLTVVFLPRKAQGEMRKLIGSMSAGEAEEMQKLIEEEFEKIEGEW